MPETGALAKRIKKYRERQDKSQFEMACDVGLSVDEISLIERCKTDPKLSTLKLIAAYMGITVSDLVSLNEDEEEEKDGETALSSV